MFGFGEGTSHPAEMGFLGKLWEGTKHVLGKTLKWAGYGAATGGAVGAVVGLPFLAPLLIASPFVGTGAAVLTGLFTSGGITGALAAGAMGVLGTIGLPVLVGAAVVGGLAAAAGAFFGLRGAGDAVAEANDEQIANFDRGQMRVERSKMMDLKMQQQRLAMVQQAQEMGISNPNMGLPGSNRGQGLHT